MATRESFREKLRKEKSTQTTLHTIHRQEEERSTQQKAHQLGIPYLDLQYVPVNPDALTTIPKEKSIQSELIVFQRAGNHLKIALVDIENIYARQILQQFQRLEYHLETYLVSKTGILKGINAYEHIQKRSRVVKDTLYVPQKEILAMKKNLNSLHDFAQRINTAETSELLQMICVGSLATDASDIHIDPKQKSVRLRYRIDGMLQDILTFDIARYTLLISRIKNLSSLVLNIKTTSQDGRFSIVVINDTDEEHQNIDVRVSILPGKNGEIIVMRLLNSQNQRLDIHSFGIRESFKQIIIRNLEQSQGLIMLSGPTGSGKTTSLYSFLNYINDSDKNIITIEDPIEYKLRGINQTQIDKKRGYTFATGLRAIVRQDPDVIMVGEIRDNETASIAVNAAITGHLVFSTIHTNDSVGIVTRLMELGLNVNIITSAMNLFVAQRLLRKLCECKTPYYPTEKETELMQKALAIISPKSGVPLPEDITTLYQPKGCPKCYGLGYKGRFAIYELFEARDNIRTLILSQSPEFKIFRKAMENGMITLFQDGLLHALQGETSLAEVLEIAGDTTYIEELYEETLSSSLSRGIYLKTHTPTTVNNQLLQQISEAMLVQEQLEIISSVALKERATDIHIEPDSGHLLIRLRIDGVLHEFARLSKSLYPQILAQLKIVTGLPLDIAHTIQEGRFTIFTDRNYDVRVSMIPGGYGQTVVLRILQADIDKMTLTNLGMDTYNLKRFQSQLRKTTGLVLVTGPTSAGKSTTLYAALNTLNQPGVKVITIEDPIEYNLSGILQTSVDESTGYTFAGALRALLRQNPNIILIGEIRDKETAKVAMQAAATGHLLLSTLHTNNAVGAVLRLYDLGIGLSEIATFVNGTVAQRIIRTLDESSKQPINLSASQKNLLQSKLPERYHHLIGDTIYSPVPTENNTDGYKGMTAIFEVFVLSDSIKTLITDGANMQVLMKQALDEGMDTLEISGIVKVLQGVTDSTELKRVLGIDIFRQDT